MPDEIAPDQVSDGVKKVVLNVCCLAQFMVVLDIVIVNVALPSIKKDLGFETDADLQWIVTSYAVTYGGLLLLGGRLGDFVGRKFAFNIGIVFFVISSIIGGFSTTQFMLLAARGLQGIGSAILSPATLTILTVTFTEPKKRATALGLWSFTAAGGGAVGALIGGVIVQLINWRWILFVNVPVGIILFVLSIKFLVESKDVQDGTSFFTIDWGGAISITSCLIVLTYGIAQTNVNGWTSMATAEALIIAGVLFILFIIFELCVKSPLVPLSIFKNLSVFGANGAILFIGAGFFSYTFFNTLWLQLILGLDPIHTGLCFLPTTSAIAVGSIIATKLCPKVGPRNVLLVGNSFAAGGLYWLSHVQYTDSYPSGTLGGSVTTAFGLGLCFMPITLLGTAGLQRKDAGLASGLINCFRQIGASLGLAVFSTLADDFSKQRIIDLCKAALTPYPTPDIIKQGLSDGFAHGFLLAGLVSLGGLLFLIILPRNLPPELNQANQATTVITNKVAVQPEELGSEKARISNSGALSRKSIFARAYGSS